MELDSERLPQHVAIIMDGNGRWARQRVRNRVFGHRKGAEAVRTIMTCCTEVGIPFLTLYAFSEENWNRPEKEVKALWQLLERYLASELPTFIKNGVRLRHIGDDKNIPPHILTRLFAVENETAHLDALTLCLALNYGGRQEIAKAASLFAADVKNGVCSADQISAERFSRYLYGPDIPDPDLVIRTGGEIRVSNFLLWQIAYAELYFTEVFWPDFGKVQFLEALAEFQKRERRFGRTGEQVRKGGRPAHGRPSAADVPLTGSGSR